MAGGIYFRREGELVRMTEQAYATELELQELLSHHPDLLSAGRAAPAVATDRSGIRDRLRAGRF
jgi:hypothetical protein